MKPEELKPSQPEQRESRIPFDLRDGVFVVGLGLVSYGAWLIFPPAGFIAGGVLLLLLATFGVRR